MTCIRRAHSQQDLFPHDLSLSTPAIDGNPHSCNPSLGSQSDTWFHYSARNRNSKSYLIHSAACVAYITPLAVAPCKPFYEHYGQISDIHSGRRMTPAVVRRAHWRTASAHNAIVIQKSLWFLPACYVCIEHSRTSADTATLWWRGLTYFMGGALSSCT